MKERLIVKELIDFIEDPNTSYPIAVVTGIRRVGKTTVLRQLQGHYPDAVYINLADDKGGFDMIADRFLDNPTSLLLLDEITYLDDYERISQVIFDQAGANFDSVFRFKVIMTGSSATHIMRLVLGRLGARSKLFRLLPLTFVEYLYFTGRIDGYAQDYYKNVTKEDFVDYLQLKGVPTNLRIHFDNSYFSAFYNEVQIANRSSYLNMSKIRLGERDLQDMANMIAYKLHENASASSMLNPKVGGQEHLSIYSTQDRYRTQMSRFDLSQTFIQLSVIRGRRISASSKARILQFLLYSGIADVESSIRDINSPSGSIMEILERLGEIELNSSGLIERENHRHLEAVLNEVSICMTSPLLYTRLGEDILRTVKVDTNWLYAGQIPGGMLEVYVRGALASYQNYGTVLMSTKLQVPNKDGIVEEVDIVNYDFGILCEVTISNKADKDIHLNKYFPNEKFIRVCTTKDKSAFNGQYHRIPYPKLCCMVDTRDVLGLKPTYGVGADVQASEF